MAVGILAWGYTLLLPSFAMAGLLDPGILAHGPFGLAILRPQALFGLNLPPLVHGVLWSLTLNLIAYVVFSLAARRLDRAPAGRPFVRPISRRWRRASACAARP